MLKSSFAHRLALKTTYNSIHFRTMSSTVSSNPTSGAEEAVVLNESKNHARLLILNRVRKLNSLNTEMVELITPGLLANVKAKENNVTILTSNSPKALCAGGDVAECAVQIRKGNPGYGADFFDKEYNMNYVIATMPKPYVSLMNNITFGGGVGLSVHAPFRVATEKTRLAMPEMDIGFFPDVGTTFFLPRLDDKLGYYTALTGSVLSGLDAYVMGFATHFIKSDKLPQVISRLANLQPPELEEGVEISLVKGNSAYFDQVNSVLNDFSEKKLPDDYKFLLSDDEIDLNRKAFSQKSIDHVLKYFEDESKNSPFAKKTLETLLQKPRTSLTIGFELMNKGLHNTIKEQLALEMVSATNIMRIPADKNDFAKGVIHKLVDKIKEPFFPQWNDPSTVTPEFLSYIFTETEETRKFLSSPLIDKWFGLDYNNYPLNYGLPRAGEVAQYIAGTDGSNRSYLPTPAEVFKHFKQKTNNKLGLELKIEQLLNLHGETAKYDNKYVSWKD
ncbi:mitochondrial 37S ribosomal protein mS47 [Lodderomyces beijingensis]|uniref:3-hydroxyisobutyryl-CoA hydrolase n=1 Tax=Lodderomyces beijingensis TaxID=1775926 RepID=A0ABP0ZL91_9ASCO